MSTKKYHPWKKDLFDAQVRDLLIMGSIDKNNTMEQNRNDNPDLLNRCNDEKIRRNVKHTAGELDKIGLRDSLNLIF